MKTYTDLYSSIVDFPNIYNAYLKTSRHKRFRSYVLEFRSQLGDNILEIQKELINGTYKPLDFYSRTIYDPKEREINISQFRDRVVQTSLVNIIEPVFDRSFYYHSYACRVGKGTHAASETLNNWIYQMQLTGLPVFVLKGDIHSFFKSVDGMTLFSIISEKINDPWTLNLIYTIIAHTPNNVDGIITSEILGIPIGNITSQLFANIYLNELDDIIIHVLKPDHYVRYMDDFILMSFDLGYLRYCMDVINEFINNVLLIQLNPKSTLLNTKNGVDFVGYKHWGTHKRLRKGSIERIYDKIYAYDNGLITDAQLYMSWKSWDGHASHADAYNIRNIIQSKIEERIDIDNIELPKSLLYL